MSNKILIPYVIFDATKAGSSIEYGSVPEDELYSCLINEIKILMELHEFDDNDDEYEDADDADLTCDECECRVISTRYITTIDGKQFCGGCNPEPNDNIIVNKETYRHFTKFLQRNDENCDIIYFKDGKWINFTVV